MQSNNMEKQSLEIMVSYTRYFPQDNQEPWRQNKVRVERKVNCQCGKCCTSAAAG